jgi:hypothetical protein
MNPRVTIIWLPRIPVRTPEGARAKAVWGNRK